MPTLTPTALVQRIKQRDTPLYDRLYRTARYIRHVNVPCIRAIHLPLYWLHRVLSGAFIHTLRLLYYQPLFTARCESVGPGLFIERGMPLVEGHLRIRLGQNVRMAGRSTFGAASLSRDPVLEIGDNSYLGYQTTITVGYPGHDWPTCPDRQSCLHRRRRWAPDRARGAPFHPRARYELRRHRG